ncbi:MAG: hypothetical protein D6744_08635 [Planctomycetota bacterium]|nr:MAG: hypothetical protein D6744_08635 [Planctomycetota bacterium]
MELESLAAEPVLSVALDPPVRIALETRNIKRFAITRIGLPLDRPGKSIALKIDGQVFEWQGKHITVVFEHSPNGGWQVIDRVAIEP